MSHMKGEHTVHRNKYLRKFWLPLTIRSAMRIIRPRMPPRQVTAALTVLPLPEMALNYSWEQAVPTFNSTTYPFRQVPPIQ